MIDARIVAAVVVLLVGLNASVRVWETKQTYQIPDGKALRCELVDRK